MKKAIRLLLPICLGLVPLTIGAQDVSYKETAQHVEAIIKNPGQDMRETKKLFKSVKEQAEKGNADAACDLGILYKDGLGCTLNLNKAKKWFKIGAEKGSCKAMYSMGYLYLKGLGNMPQDYKKAVKWFKKTDYPMAVHWLAKCYYHGFGVPEDKEKAVGMLRENPSGSSQVLLAQWEHEMAMEKKGTPIVSKGFDALPQNPLMAASSDGLSESILGVWAGTWELMDWSGQKLMRSVPLVMEISENGTGLLNAKFITTEQEFTGDLVRNGNELVFPDMIVSLRKRYTDNPAELLLDHRLTSLRFSIKRDAGVPVLNATLETNILNWSEPGPPGRLKMKKIKNGLSQEIMAALAGQQDHFIKVYPNPFEEDLLVHYTLKEDAEVNIRLVDYYAPQREFGKKVHTQKKGDRTLSFGNLNGLKSGLYIIHMNVNGEAHSRIVIKNQP